MRTSGSLLKATPVFVVGIVVLAMLLYIFLELMEIL